MPPYHNVSRHLMTHFALLHEQLFPCAHNVDRLSQYTSSDSPSPVNLPVWTGYVASFSSSLP